MSDSVIPPEIAEMAKGMGKSPASDDWLIIAGAGIVVGIVATVWIYYRRKNKRHRLLQSLDLHRSTSGDHGGHSHRGHRRRRRNPTLAQTGGLPPERTDTPPASAQPQ